MIELSQKIPNKSVSLGSLSLADISDCAVVILTEPIEKHGGMVYELGAEILTNEQRAAIFSKVLGKLITYEQQSMNDFYNHCISFGMAHVMAYNSVSFYSKDSNRSATPELAIILGRPLRTLEEWLKENAAAFQSTQ